MSVCTGAFPLTAAGLLDGLVATTHWRWAEPLAPCTRSARCDLSNGCAGVGLNSAGQPLRYAGLGQDLRQCRRLPDEYLVQHAERTALHSAFHLCTLRNDQRRCSLAPGEAVVAESFDVDQVRRDRLTRPSTSSAASCRWRSSRNCWFRLRWLAAWRRARSSMICSTQEAPHRTPRAKMTTTPKEIRSRRFISRYLMMSTLGQGYGCTCRVTLGKQLNSYDRQAPREKEVGLR